MFNLDNLALMFTKFAAISKAFSHLYGAVEAKQQSRKSTGCFNSSFFPHFSGCTVQSKLLNLFEPKFPHLVIITFRGLLQGHNS